MSDTRPEMTHAEFEAAANYAYDDRTWLTGEEHFLHVSAVMAVEGWNRYGSDGHNSLTEPQRVLMMWSDLVGQTANGGFTQFADNYEYALPLAHPAIGKLGWPDLFARFDRAFREQAGDPDHPKLKGGDTSWPAKRSMIIAHRAKKSTRFAPWARAREVEALSNFDDITLSIWYHQAISSGDLAPLDEPDEEDVPTEEAEAFDDWFYLDETRKASKQFVGDFIRRHRDDLCRLAD